MALLFLSPIHKSSRQIAIHLEGMLADFGLTTTESHVLVYLRSYAPCSIGELHRVFGYKRSTLTSLLDRLDAKGLAVREPDRDDRRSIILKLTRNGKTMANRINRLIEALERAIRSKVKSRDIDGFHEVMAAIEKATEVNIKGGKGK